MSENERIRLWIKSHLELINDAKDLEDYRKAFACLESKRESFRWHPATEAPGKRRVLMAFTRKDLKKGQYVFAPVRLFSETAIPAECVFEDGDDGKQLPVAWVYYDEAIKGINEQMCRSAAAYAWGWWPDDDDK